MKKDLNKDLYSSPECEALELRLEGVVAASGGASPQDYNNPFGSEQTW